MSKQPKKIVVRDPIGKKEAAAILGVHPNNMGALKGVPEPATKVAATPLWERRVIEEFARKRELAKS